MSLLEHIKLMGRSKPKAPAPEPEQAAFASWGGRERDSEWTGTYRQADHVAAPRPRPGQPGIGFEGPLPGAHPEPVLQLDVVSAETRGDAGLPPLDSLLNPTGLVQELDHSSLLAAYDEAHQVGKGPFLGERRPLV